MASTLSKILAIFLVLNLLFVSLASACGSSCGGANPYPNPNPKPSPSSGGYPGSGGGSPSTGGGSPSTGGGGYLGKCPKDTLKLGVCANVLTDLINLKIGSPPKEPCCPLIQGLVDAEVAVCLCTAIKANILGIHLDIPVNLSLLVNYCGRTLPTGFQCP